MPDNPLISPRKTGYLASVINVPPLIFRFQTNPDILSEKKTFKYRSANSFGSWKFDQTANAGAGIAAAAVTALVPGASLLSAQNDIKEIGSLLVATKPLEAEEGEPRTFAIDFVLDVTVPWNDGSAHYGGSIEPDLAVLRAFMNPSWDLIDVGKLIASGFKDPPCWNKPPPCSLYYAGLSLECVMTDLNIKVTAFKDDGKPARAEVGVTLREQTFSASPIIEYFTRFVQIAKSLGRPGFGKDLMAVTPILNLFDSD
jgi:hypothetical protein